MLIIQLIKLSFNKKGGVKMNERNRKYARTTKKCNQIPESSEDTDFSLSTTMALGIVGGAFLIGMVSGTLVSKCRSM